MGTKVTVGPSSFLRSARFLQFSTGGKVAAQVVKENRVTKFVTLQVLVRANLTSRFLRKVENNEDHNTHLQLPLI